MQNRLNNYYTILFVWKSSGYHLPLSQVYWHRNPYWIMGNWYKRRTSQEIKYSHWINVLSNLIWFSIMYKGSKAQKGYINIWKKNMLVFIIYIFLLILISFILKDPALTTIWNILISLSITKHLIFFGTKRYGQPLRHVKMVD